MTDDAWEPIAEAIARGDADGVAALIEALDEADRLRLNARAKKVAKRYDDALGSGVGDAAHAALLGTSSSAAALQVPWFGLEVRDRLVRCRPREWRQDWAERMLASEIPELIWKEVHQLVKDGVIDEPESVGYITGAVGGMWFSQDNEPPSALAEILRGEAQWVERHLWRLFDLEETALTSTDAFHVDEQSWHIALRELAADGTISRDRLLD